MQTPATTNTIVAVSTGWRAAPLGIVRLSGPDAFELVRTLARRAFDPPDSPRASFSDVWLHVPGGLRLPATIFCFHEPHSFTGQNVSEIHTIGSLPALRAISSALIELGARRALPGEFTARAFMNGRLGVDQVEGVLQLITSSDRSSARQAARLAASSQDTDVNQIADRVADLLSSVEAGIDFTEEEDVSFITPEQLRTALDELIRRVEPLAEVGVGDWRRGKPHVALAGLPNAGKSTLFNALAGRERAIVSPILGTTRDVLSVEIEADGVSLVLQDSAGVGAEADELESAAHLASEDAADQADLVLWVHDSGEPWRRLEIEACRRIPAERRALVCTKIDQPHADRDAPPISFAAGVVASALTGEGLPEIRAAFSRLLSALPSAPGLGLSSGRMVAALASLRRARRLASDSSAGVVASPELVSLELRGAWESLASLGQTQLVEDVLGKIMARFCVGK